MRKCLCICGMLVLAACAPKARDKTEPVAEVTPEPKTAPEVVPTPTLLAEVPAVATATPVPQKAASFDPKKPDWKLRYQQLYTHFESEFTAPAVGDVVKIEMVGGTIREGVLIALREDSLDVRIGESQLTLQATQMTERSQAQFFKRAYAHLGAVTRGRQEYQRWQQMQVASRPTPVPTRASLPPQGPTQGWPAGTGTRPPPGQVVGGRDGLNRAHKVDPKAKPPKNEGPKGRVWQVDQYIRRNAAVPHSLRYKSWGRVQPDKNGYKVRVQYSLESADGFGTSHEDMTFFMHKDGHVYRRAPNKGG